MYQTHGMSRTPTYSSWHGMKGRCNNENHHKYHLYGGRGISLCERWHDFSNFLEDMGERPEVTTLDRIDSEKGYEPGNCRWATPTEQNRNKRTSVYLELHGILATVEEWSEVCGIHPMTIRSRLRKDADVRKALTLPVHAAGQEAPRKNKTSHKGVYFCKSKKLKKWAARVNFSGQSKNLGYFLTEDEAALAYNEAAKELLGEHAYLNEVA